ncbi:MAG: cellulase family glycosylhydrolase [Nibricoccus sp.]
MILAFTEASAQEPVEFEFKASPTDENPFARVISAEVILPSGVVRSLPAFYKGRDLFGVRARCEGEGEYRLGRISESRGGSTETLHVRKEEPNTRTIRSLARQKYLALDRADPGGFVFSSGERFLPLGANLAWPDHRGVEFYLDAFQRFHKGGLNWSRLWMAHWSGLNLEWLPARVGRSPAMGEFDLHVAAEWDKIIAAAAENQIYLQLVLQHHGQYSSTVNTNWLENPWNVANGGFLKSPAEFFTSAEAQRLTRMKFRYIVARWGYSPAIMAWELFNEVHWTDAIRGETKDEAAVARWHSEMAKYIRSIDVYSHLITTSTENLESPIYADMDYYQPHLYRPNLLAGARRFDIPPEALRKPVFYGEAGDDQLPISDEDKKSGAPIVPPVWASLMGQGKIPAQPWLGLELIETGRIEELAAVSRFLADTKLFERTDLRAFSPAVETAERMPFRLIAGFRWQHRQEREIVVPADGRDQIDFAELPGIFVSEEEHGKSGYPHRTMLRVDFPRETTMRLHIADTDATAGGIRVSIDGRAEAEMVWAERPADSPDQKGPHPQSDLAIAVPGGTHVVTIENPVSSGWFWLPQIEFGCDMPVLAAAGKRADAFIAVWLWDRRSVFSAEPAKNVAGNLSLDDVPAGTWQVTWWDSVKGVAAPPVVVEHGGGRLPLTVPPLTRHAAVVLERASK